MNNDELKFEVSNFLSKNLIDGFNSTSEKSIDYIKFSEESETRTHFWEPSFAIILQGSKQISVGGITSSYKDGQFVINPVGLPVESKITNASKVEPFLCLIIEFDESLFREVVSNIKIEKTISDSSPNKSVFFGSATAGMLDTTFRLIKLLASKFEDKSYLISLMKKELFYYLLKSPEGERIIEFALQDSRAFKLAHIIADIQKDLAKDIDTLELSREANMSRSAFFKHFKDYTSMSPIQFQKKLRLIEAQKLLFTKKYTAQECAFKVGYKSTSQFSREYSRMFGKAPIQSLL